MALRLHVSRAVSVSQRVLHRSNKTQGVNMGCLVAQIATLVLGIMALIKGEVKLTGKKIVRGPRARVIGVLLLLPLTLSLLGGFVLGLVIGIQGREVNLKELQGPATIINVSTFVIPLGIALLLSLLPGGQQQRRRRQDDDWDDDRDDDWDDEDNRRDRRRGRRARDERDAYDDRDDRGPRAERMGRAEREEAIRPGRWEKQSAETAARQVEPPLPEARTTIACPSCSKQLAVPAGNLGKSVRCPKCQQVFVAQPAPLPVRITCVQCHTELRVPEAALGKSVRCPKCQTVFVA